MKFRWRGTEARVEIQHDGICVYLEASAEVETTTRSFHETLFENLKIINGDTSLSKKGE